MPKPKSGKGVKADGPTEALEADIADPGKMAKIKAEQREQKKGKYGSAKVDKQADGDKKQEEKQEEKKTWVEFQLLDAASKPVGNEKCKIILPDGKEKTDQTNGKGVVRVNDLEPGASVKIRFPDRYDYEWKDLRVEDPGDGAKG